MHGKGADPRLGKRFIHQRLQFLRRTVAGAADAKGKTLRREVQGAGAGLGGLCSAGDGQIAALRQIVEPTRRRGVAARDRRPATRQERSHRRFGIRRIGKPPARGRSIQRHAQRHIARRCHSRHRSERFGNRFRQPVRAPMAAKKRHDDRAVIRHRNHRRLVPFVAQMRGDGTDQDAAGANANHRHAGKKQIARMNKRVVKDHVGLIHAPLAAMNLGAERLGNAVGSRLARTGKRENDGGHSHGSAPLVSRIIEK